MTKFLTTFTVAAFLAAASFGAPAMAGAKGKGATAEAKECLKVSDPKQKDECVKKAQMKGKKDMSKKADKAAKKAKGKK